MSIARRTVFDLGLAATMAIAVRPPAVRAAPPDGPQVGDVFVLEADKSVTVTAAMLTDGAGPQLAWPKDPKIGLVRDTARFNQVLLLRISDAAGANEDKVVAFTAICPHAACLVTGWVPGKACLRCPCHGSEYDPARNGIVVSGPSPLPLPILPVQVDRGAIVVTGPFSARPGAHTSRTM
jgi:rieske iron-sulfur protein